MPTVTPIATVSAAHRLLSVTPPSHPLISVLPHGDFPAEPLDLTGPYRLDLYLVSLKPGIAGSFGYGRATYDFQEGTLLFTAPGQVLSFHEPQTRTASDIEGWTLLIHPDLLRGSVLAQALPDFSFFRYAANEALHVSARERATLAAFVDNVAAEIAHNIDKHSRELILVNLESLLRYSARFYERLTQKRGPSTPFLRPRAPARAAPTYTASRPSCASGSLPQNW